jgi:hypothetical protein
MMGHAFMVAEAQAMAAAANSAKAGCTDLHKSGERVVEGISTLKAFWTLQGKVLQGTIDRLQHEISRIPSGSDLPIQLSGASAHTLVAKWKNIGKNFETYQLLLQYGADQLLRQIRPA